MYATVRRIKAQPGKGAEVAELIMSGYLPLISGVEGFVGYTLVDIGDDEVSSLGLFDDEDSARAANAAAHDWAAATLQDLVAGPLEAREGAVLIATSPAGAA